MGPAPIGLDAAHPFQVALALGLGDWVAAAMPWLPREFVDENAERGYIISLRITPDGTYVPGPVRTGAEALVAVGSSVAGREMPVRLVPVAEVWRLVVAQHAITRLSIPDPGVWAWASADIRRDETIWTVEVEDCSGAGAAVLAPEIGRALLPSGLGGEVGRARRSAELVEASGDGAARAVAAEAAWRYVDGQAQRQDDRGRQLVHWVVYRDDLGVAWDLGAPVAATLGRLARLRGSVAAELARDASGRTRLDAVGSSRRWRPLPTDDALRIRHAHGDRIQWVDEVGETAAGLVDEELDWPNMRWAPATPGPIGLALERLRLAGLSERQAEMLVASELGYSQIDLATAFGCARSTVANTISAARKKLRPE